MHFYFFMTGVMWCLDRVCGCLFVLDKMAKCKGILVQYIIDCFDILFLLQ